MMIQGDVSAGPDIRFETLFEQAPFSIQVLATDGRTLRVNAAWKRLWQMPDDDRLVAYVLEQYNVLEDPELEAKGITPYFRRAFAGESVELPLTLFNHAQMQVPAQIRWIKAQANPVLDGSGHVREVMLIHEDVTAQIDAEKALAASAHRMEQLANSIPQLAWIADATGAINWFNSRWYEYTGTNRDEMEGWGWQSVHHPCSRLSD